MSWDDDRTFAVSRIRPYLLTGGRTKSQMELPLELQIRSTRVGDSRRDELAHEANAIVELCDEPKSVAEISAHVGIHLEVARILIGDLVSEGLLDTGSAPGSAQRPDVKLLEQVLDGLQSF